MLMRSLPGRLPDGFAFVRVKVGDQLAVAADFHGAGLFFYDDQLEPESHPTHSVQALDRTAPSVRRHERIAEGLLDAARFTGAGGHLRRVHARIGDHVWLAWVVHVVASGPLKGRPMGELAESVRRDLDAVEVSLVCAWPSRDNIRKVAQRSARRLWACMVREGRVE